MKIKTAEISGFRSFRARTLIEFGDPGLVFVTGKNLVEPALGANGAGKSSIFEALYWCLYGKTSRGLKAGNIKSWGAGGTTVVEVAVEALGKAFTVRREQGPNRLCVGERASEELREVDQQTLEGMLGISPKAFLYSIFFAQFSPSFLDLSASEQMALFTEVLNLDLWEAASDQASKEAKVLEARAQVLEVDLGRQQGSLIAKRAFIEQEGYRVADQVRERYLRGVALKENIKDARRALAEAEALAERHSKEDKKVRADLKEMKDHVEEQRDAAIDQMKEWRFENRQLEQVKKPKTTCVLCGSPLDGKQIKAGLVAYEEAQEKIKENMALLEEAEKWVKDWDLELKDLYKALDDRSDAAEHIRQVATRKAVLQNELGAKERLMRADLPKEDPELAAELKALETEYRGLKEGLAALRKEGEGLRYWQKEFKELRLYLIEESLTQLEVECNSALHQLGLEGWRIEFDVEREKKTGGVKTGFSVLIYSPVTESVVPWEAWSGGESQRMRLAVAMGLSSLITSRLGADTNVEFWDEPSTWLSTSGITDLMHALKSRAQDNGKQIWVADHRALEFGGFSKTVVVTKDSSGSSIT